MTTQVITHKCGHEVEKNINLVQKKAIAKQVEFHASRDCIDCFKENSAKNDLGAIAEYQFLLAKLEGSEKQVSWAEGLRVRKLAEITKFVDDLVDSLGGKDSLTSAQIDRGYRQVRVLEAVTSAKFWIDTRDLTAIEILDQSRREVV